jgi:hypothetical protein
VEEVRVEGGSSMLGVLLRLVVWVVFSSGISGLG